MAIFEKDGKKSFSMNPQVGRALHGGLKPMMDAAVSTGAKPAEHGGEAIHHVEVHHGGHPQGEPPMHEGHTHHTIHHPERGGEPHIKNHENYNEAESATRESMGGEEAVPGAEALGGEEIGQ